MHFEILVIPKVITFPIKLNTVCVAVYAESMARAKMQPDPMKLAPFSSPLDFCLIALQASETSLAELPELPPTQFGLGSPPDWLPVGAPDESTPETLPASTDRAVGEAHPYKQTWLQLVSWWEKTQDLTIHLFEILGLFVTRISVSFK